MDVGVHLARQAIAEPLLNRQDSGCFDE